MIHRASVMAVAWKRLFLLEFSSSSFFFPLSLSFFSNILSVSKQITSSPGEDACLNSYGVHHRVSAARMKRGKNKKDSPPLTRPLLIIHVGCLVFQKASIILCYRVGWVTSPSSMSAMTAGAVWIMQLSRFSLSLTHVVVSHRANRTSFYSFEVSDSKSRLSSGEMLTPRMWKGWWCRCAFSATLLFEWSSWSVQSLLTSRNQNKNLSGKIFFTCKEFDTVAVVQDTFLLLTQQKR